MIVFRSEQTEELRENLDILTERWDWKETLFGVLEDVLSLNDLKALNDRLNQETKRSSI